MKRRLLVQAMEACIDSPPDELFGASFPEPIELPYDVVCRWPSSIGKTEVADMLPLWNEFEDAFARSLRYGAQATSITMSFGALVAHIQHNEPQFSEEEARKVALDFLREHKVID